MSKTKTDNNQSVSQTRRSPVAAARRERKPKRKARPGFRQRRSRKRQAIPDRPVLEPNAASMDIGAREIYVAVPADTRSIARTPKSAKSERQPCRPAGNSIYAPRYTNCSGWM